MAVRGMEGRTDYYHRVTGSWWRARVTSEEIFSRWDLFSSLLLHKIKI